MGNLMKPSGKLNEKDFIFNTRALSALLLFPGAADQLPIRRCFQRFKTKVYGGEQGLSAGSSGV